MERENRYFMMEVLMKVCSNTVKNMEIIVFMNGEMVKSM